MAAMTAFRANLARNPRLWLAAGAEAVYLVAFILLSRSVGIGAAALTPIPVLVLGGLWGIRAGVFAALSGLPVNSFLLLLTGQQDWGLLAHPPYLAGAAASVIVGAVAGHMHNLRQQMKRELLTRELAEEELCRSDHRYQTLVETAPDIIYRLGIDGMITSLNPAFEKITGRPVDEVIGKPFGEIIHAEDVHLARAGFEQAVLHGLTPAPVELRVRAKNGEYLTGEFSSAPLFENGQIVGNFGVARDITGRKRAEEKLRHIAYYDALTGLPNRELFLDRLHQAIIQARRYKRMLAVMLLDIDRFKEINDTLGHRTGDLLLKAVGDRINRCVREGDTVARHGGDEFIILFSGVSHIQRCPKGPC
jgi:PAS domain S-box-containing protein